MILENESVCAVAGKPMPVTSDLTIRFVDREGDSPVPVFYHKGQRITEPINFTLVAKTEGDPFRSANTAEVEHHKLEF